MQTEEEVNTHTTNTVLQMEMGTSPHASGEVTWCGGMPERDEVERRKKKKYAGRDERGVMPYGNRGEVYTRMKWYMEEGWGS